MKQLTWKLALPLTIISFVSLTKWWYVIRVDAPDTMMYGFPLAFMADGWHTSMSIQFFAIEFVIDLMTYFLFWLLIVMIVHRFAFKIVVPKIITGILVAVSALVIVGSTFIVSLPEHVFLLNRSFDVNVLKTGPKFIWKWQERPNPNDFITDGRR